jgi:hypothetical protein
MKLWTKKIGRNQMRETKSTDPKSTGHEINGNDPLNQMIDPVTYLTLLLGSLVCSSKHKSQAHLSVTSVCTLHDAADFTEHH